jgi:hypothetical protein
LGLEVDDAEPFRIQTSEPGRARHAEAVGCGVEGRQDFVRYEAREHGAVGHTGLPSQPLQGCTLGPGSCDERYRVGFGQGSDQHVGALALDQPADEQHDELSPQSIAGPDVRSAHVE